MTCVWLDANTLILPSAPIGAITLFGRATPASKFTLETSWSVAIRREHGEVARSDGVSGSDVEHRRGRTDRHPRRTGDLDIDRLACVPPVPRLSRVSRTRSGTTVNSRALPPGPNQPKTSTITSTLALAKMRMRPPVPTFATTVFGEAAPGGEVHTRRARLRSTIREDREEPGCCAIDGSDVQRHGERCVGHVAAGHLDADRSARRARSTASTDRPSCRRSSPADGCRAAGSA